MSPAKMRPDPHKRAKSRQYKVKHGIIDQRKATKNDLVLPSNISEENILLDLEPCDQDEMCLNFDEMDFSFDSNKALDKFQYKYPQKLYEKLFEFKDKSSDNIASSSTISNNLSHKLSLPEYYFYDDNARITIRNENLTENYNTERVSQLKLQKDECYFEKMAPINKVKVTDDKLELENWLDQIL